MRARVESWKQNKEDEQQQNIIEKRKSDRICPTAILHMANSFLNMIIFAQKAYNGHPTFQSNKKDFFSLVA